MFETLEDRTAPAVYEVPGSYSLHQAITDAELSSDVNNVILLAQGNYTVADQLVAALPDNTVNPPRLRSITILGSGAVLDAKGAGRVLELDGNVTLTNLTIQGGVVQGTAGAAQAEGGGLLIDDGSTVTLNHVVVQNNGVLGAAGTQAAGQPAYGGGIYVTGATTVTMINCTITGNEAIGGDGDAGPNVSGSGIGYADGFDGGAAAGGGLYVASGEVVLESTQIDGNQALGGNGGNGGIYMSSDYGPEGQVGGRGASASGGGLYDAGTVALLAGSIGSNTAQGGAGGNGSFPGGTGAQGGSAQGGGCLVQELGDLSVVALTSSANTAQGGDGGQGASGEAQNSSDSILGALQSGGGYWGGGGAEGGGFYAFGGAGLELYNVTSTGDQAIGGDGQNGGNGGGAATYTDAYGDNYGSSGGFGGNGGPGGGATGGGLASDSNNTLINCTFKGDVAQGGNGGNAGASAPGAYGYDGGGDGGGGGNGGAGGAATGGGIYITLAVQLVGDSISGAAIGGQGGNASAGSQGGDGGGSPGGVGPGGPGGAGGQGGSSTGGDAYGGGADFNLNDMSILSTIAATTYGGAVNAGAAGAAGGGGAGGNPDGVSRSGGTATAGQQAGASSYGAPNLAGGSASSLQMSPMPPSVVAGVPLAFPVYVVAYDSNHDVASNFGGTVTLTLYNAQGGNLGVVAIAAASNGVAVFPGLNFALGGAGFTLTASSGGMTANDPFDVVGYTPAQIRTAYGFNSLPLDAKGNILDGTGQTIAVIGAYNDPNLPLDLDAFDQQFGVAVAGPTLYAQYGAASSFLTVYDQTGHKIDPVSTNDPPEDPAGQANSNWEGELVMDVEWAHAIAPGAHIALVECNTDNASDIFDGAAVAAGLPGVSVISMSLGYTEGHDITLAGEQIYDNQLADYAANGITVLAASGDKGTKDAGYPAFSPYVIAVGGTSLAVGATGSYMGEIGWGYVDSQGNLDASGGGPSQYENRPDYQAAVQWSGARMIPDVSMVADPLTGSAVYDGYNEPGTAPWAVGGGTSLSTPCWAGLIAIANQGRVAVKKPVLNTSAERTQVLDALYSFSPADFHNNLGGVNGTNTSELINPARYDEITGLGSPLANRVVPDLIAYSTSSKITINPPSLPAGTVAVAYRQQLQVIGGIAPYRFTVSSGPLPDGLSLSSSGVLGGIPTRRGSFNFTVQVADTNGATGHNSYTLVVAPGTPTVKVVDAGGTFNTHAFPASAKATGVTGTSTPGGFAFTYYVGKTATGSGSTTAPTNAGTYTVVAAFTSTNANYSNARSSPVTFIVVRAAPKVTAADAGGIYNGKPFPATAKAIGLNNASVTGNFVFTYYTGSHATGTGSPTAPANAGTYTVVASFTSSNANYTNARSSPVTFIITPRTPRSQRMRRRLRPTGYANGSSA